MFTSLMVLAFVNSVDGAPAHAGHVKGSPGDTEITDISEAERSREAPAAISSMNPSTAKLQFEDVQDVAKPAVGESLSVGRGRGKKTRRMRARGNFVLVSSKRAAGGLKQ